MRKSLSLLLMKRVLTYSFIILMAALVFYGGAGINVYSFCCDECRDAGMEVLTGDKCCEIHGHHHDEATVFFEEDNDHAGHAHEMCCDLKRLRYDWGFEDVSNPDMEPLVVDLFDAGLPDISLIPLPYTKEINTAMPNGPPLPPRVYLSLLTTLLI